MSLKSAVSSKICGLNSLIFNELRDGSTNRQTRSKLGKIASFSVNDIRLSHLPLGRDDGDLLFEVEGDDFHSLPAIEDGVGKKPFYEHAQAAECYSGDQRKPDHDATKNNRVEEKVRQIIFFGDVGIFIPGHVGFVADGGHERARFAF